jgi:uncharacterized protein
LIGTSTSCLVDVGQVSLDVALDVAFGGLGPSAPDALGRPVRAIGVAIVAHPHLLFGGSRDNKVVITIAKALTNHGFHVLRPNFRGVGETSGVFDEGRGESQDLLSLYQMCAGEVPPKWWPQDGGFDWPTFPHRVLAGFSFGAFVQTLVAQQVVMDAASMVLAGLAVTRFPVAATVAGSLVVHGEQDDVVPLVDVFDWARPLAQPVVVMPGAGHFFHGHLIGLRSIVSDHLLARYNRALVTG